MLLKVLLRSLVVAAVLVVFVLVFRLPRHAIGVYQGSQTPYVIWSSKELYVFITENIGFKSYRLGLELLARVVGTGAQTGSFGTLRTDLVIFRLQDETLTKHVVKDSRYSLPFPLNGHIVTWRDEALYCWKGDEFVACSDAAIKGFFTEWQSPRYQTAKSKAGYAGYSEANFSFSDVGLGKQETSVSLAGKTYNIRFVRSELPKNVLGYVHKEVLVVEGPGILTQPIWESASEQPSWVSQGEIKRLLGESAQITNTNAGSFDPRK